MQNIDLQPAVFVVNEVRQINQQINEQRYNFHAILTRFNGRIDYLNLQQGSTIITSNFAPNLQIIKSIPVYNENQLYTLCYSAELPNQLLLFDPYRVYALQTITLNFGDITDIAVIQNDIVVVTFYQGTVVVYKFNSKVKDLQQLSYLQTGYKNIRHLEVNTYSTQLYKQDLYLEFSATQKEYMLIFRMKMDGTDLVKHSQYRHSSWINATGFIAEYLLVGDQNNKLTLMDQNFNTNYVFNSRMPISRIHCTKELLYLCSSSSLIVFKYNIGQNKRVRLTDLLKTQQAPFDIVGICDYGNIITYYNQLGQFFQTNKEKISVDTIFTFNSIVNDAFINQLDEHTILYQSQNGIDIFNYHENKILLRLEMDNILLQFNQMMQEHIKQQEVQEKRHIQHKINPNFIQDINLTVVNSQNAILVISDFYNNETKFLLLNKMEDQYIVANLFQEDDVDDSNMTKLPACLRIVSIQSLVYCLLFQEYIVIVSLDENNYFLPCFRRIYTLPVKNVTSELKICQGSAKTENTSQLFVAYFNDHNKNILMQLFINYDQEYMISIQNQLETQNISSMILLNNQLVTTQNNLVIYDQDLHYIKQIEIMLENTALRKIIGQNKNLIITYKKYYAIDDDKLEIVHPEVKHFYKTLFISENLKCYFYEQEVYGQFYYIATRANDLTKFGKMQ